MSKEDERLERLRLQEDHIGRAIAASEASGELRAAPSFGRPLAAAEGWEQTPPELRMPFKILKDARVVPPEVEAMQQIAALQAELDARPPGAPDDDAVRTQRQRLAELRQQLALRLERLRATGTL